MARPLRIIFAGAWYHVMNRGANHQQIFINDKHRNMFLSILGETSRIYGIEIHSYCLMGNHYHLIIHTPRGNISDAMRHINSKYTQLFNLDLKRDGPLFRGRYKAILISAEEYLIQVSRYIHRNPLEVGMIEKLEQSRWSSYQYFIDKNVDIPSWLVITEVINRFRNCYTISYKEYVEKNDLDELDINYKNSSVKPVLGSEDYCKLIFESLKSKSLSAEIVGKDRIIAPPDFSTILNNISSYFKIDIQNIKNCNMRIKNPARRIAMYLCRELGGYSFNEIAKSMGNINYHTVASTITKCKKDKTLTKHISTLRKKILEGCKTLNEGHR